MKASNIMMVAFAWILPGRLAGSGRPGLVRATARDLRSLRKQGVGLVVTLTEEPLDESPEQFDMRGIHFPIQNMGVPDLEDVDEVCRQVIEVMERGESVLIHCRSGLGRTGMMLACTLVAMGLAADEAMMTLRGIQRDYVQTRGQERLIREYAQLISSRGHARSALLPLGSHMASAIVSGALATV